MFNLRHSEAARLKRPGGNVVAPLIGLIAGVVCLLVFVSDLALILEIDVDRLIVAFVLCGAAAGIGLLLLSRSVPEPKAETLFNGGFVQPSMRTEASDKTTQCPPDVAKAAGEKACGKESISHAGPPRNASRYKAREGPGALGFITLIGVCLILGGRLSGGWEFLSFVLPAGVIMGLVLHWVNGRGQHTDIQKNKIPVSGGVVGFAAIIGMSIIMMRFGFLRLFLGLAVSAGGAIALFLHWGRRRREPQHLFCSTPEQLP